MDAERRAQVAFHLTGRITGGGLVPLAELDLEPALFAPYRDLARLRYDYPLVLGSGDAPVRALSRVIDAAVQAHIPEGIDGERTRRYVLHVEAGIRARVAARGALALGAAWDDAARDLPDDARANAGLAAVRGALDADAELVDCDASTPERVIKHAWRAVQREKAARLAADIDRLVVKLEDILRAEFTRSEAGRDPRVLQAAFGTAHREAFDFGAMSAFLKPVAAKAPPSPAREARVRAALAALQAERARLADTDATFGAHPDRFESCAAATAMLNTRLPEMIAFVKAAAIAELEIEGRYLEGEHDAFFAAFDASAVGKGDLGRFPDSLVCLDAHAMPAGETERLMELLASGLPVKVLVHADDLLTESSLGSGVGLSPKGAALASMAVGLADAFVLQASTAALHACADRVLAGMRYAGPALYSIFGPYDTGAVAPYLASAAATESRAFPTFAFDPAAGDELAARFFLGDNPQRERDWPVERLACEDGDRQRVTLDVAFTFADFAACDARHARHFACVPRRQWSDAMVPVADWLARPTRTPDEVPYILMVDREGVLQRVIVDDALVQAARRALERWHTAQEMGGVHNSHAAHAVARERSAWEAQRAAEATPAPASAPVAEATAAQAAPAEAVAPEPAAGKPANDAAYIETPRCSSCNECVRLNDRMFAYNENKQAYIKDLAAGTYRQLVEAAESCQIGIIHPGRPRNPAEPGLEELVQRAAPFLG